MKVLKSILASTALLGQIACAPDFLEPKPSSSIVAPTSISDLQGLMENDYIVNRTVPGLAEMAADDYIFIDFQSWQGTYSAMERNSYIWTKDIYEGETDIRDWSFPYKAIFICNNVIEGLKEITPADRYEEETRRFVMGWALFTRAFNYHSLVRVFSPPYNEHTAATDPGVPLRLQPGIDRIETRASVQQVYDLIFSDLQQAIALLPRDIFPNNRNRPSKAAAYALLSRIYLSMGNYPNAENYADSTLAIYQTLIDYNEVDTAVTTPFTESNAEVLYSSSTAGQYNILGTRTSNSFITPDPQLIDLYREGDLRLPIYFATGVSGQLTNKRRYSGTYSQPFTGLATDEIYLIKSECLARRNMFVESIGVLNSLLRNRYKKEFFIEESASSGEEALAKVLLERRKELVWRTIRFDDLRRLNMEGREIVVTRLLNGQNYTLEPNSQRYVLPIPDNEIELSQITQNTR